MSQYQHQVGRGDSAAVERLREYEHAVDKANKRIDALIEETRMTFGRDSISGPQINDARRCIFAEHGLPGLVRLAHMFEQCLATNIRPAMDFWESL